MLRLVLIIFLVSTFTIGYGQILKYDTRVFVDKNFVKHTERSFVVQINDNKSHDLAEIYIHHSPDQKLDLQYARIVDLNGKVLRTVKKKDVLIKNARTNQAFFQDDLVAQFDMYWNEYPYRVEYSYKLVAQDFLHLTYWNPVIHESVKTAHATLEVDVPANYQLNYYDTDSLLINRSERDGRKSFKWMYNGQMQSLKQPSITIRRDGPEVLVVPKIFHYGISGSFDSWKSFGQWNYDLNKNALDLTLADKENVKSLIKGLVDKEEIVKTLYYYLQEHTKYVNVSIDIGGLKSYPASYVSEKKYGDCKALTTYMKALLSVAGIESNYILVKSGVGENDIVEDFPSQQFNHVILSVPLENDTLWLENTSDYLPFDYLGRFIQDRWGLSVEDDNSHLVRIPKVKIEDTGSIQKYAFRKVENQWKADIELRLEGSVFEACRYFIKNEMDDRFEDVLSDQVNLKNYTINSWELVNFHRDSLHVNIKTEGELGNLFRKIGNMHIVQPLIVSLPSLAHPEDQKDEYAVGNPINRVNKMNVKLEDLPVGEIKIPESKSLKSKFGTYVTSFTLSEEEVVVNESIVIPNGKIAPEEYSDFYAFVDEIIKYKKRSAIIIQ
ncbi:hypothetical protein HNQ88_004149 [Aureibacter tunicatorum]|uniref:DUF3857 domain-containing protein n=1 Tax=Aureibacter tunicatorum TaxID=866807 RepID=A0AAE3XS38_9BACT|nr:hypothetical protein [Aureibacter tunicatorum]